MAKNKRYVDVSKGYNRAAHKAATMAVVEEDYYEELSNADTAVEMFRVSEEERTSATQAVETATQRNERQSAAQQSGQDGGQDVKKPGLIGRLFGALRKLG